MDIAGMRDRMMAVIAAVPGVTVAYLYGSFLTRDDFRDIDVALVLDSGLSCGHQESVAEDAGLALEEAISFSMPVDIRVINDAPPWFQYEVISTGTVLYARTDEERYDFEIDVMIEYLDMKYTYDLFDREYLAKA